MGDPSELFKSVAALETSGLRHQCFRYRTITQRRIDFLESISAKAMENSIRSVIGTYSRPSTSGNVRSFSRPALKYPWSAPRHGRSWIVGIGGACEEWRMAWQGYIITDLGWPGCWQQFGTGGGLKRILSLPAAGCRTVDMPQGGRGCPGIRGGVSPVPVQQRDAWARVFSQFRRDISSRSILRSGRSKSYEFISDIFSARLATMRCIRSQAYRPWDENAELTIWSRPPRHSLPQEGLPRYLSPLNIHITSARS